MEHYFSLAKRLSFSFLFTILCVSASPAGVKSDVRVITSDDRGIVLEYTPAFKEPASISEGSQVFQRWTFEGARMREGQLPGDPALSVKSFLVAFPGISGHTVEVLSADYETIQDVVLEPLADIQGDFDHLKRIVKPSPSAYGRNEFLPAQITEVANTGFVRGAALGEVRISPLQYNPASRTLRKYRRILLRVNFGSPAYRFRRAPDDPLMKDLALNYDVARNWEVGLPSAPTQFRDSSVFSNGPWFHFTLTESGMYKLTGTSLLAAGVPSSTDPRTIKVFSNGGKEPPGDPAAAYPEDVLELAVYVNDVGTANNLDASDYIIFYGQGTRGWNYNPSTRSFFHTINLYSEAAHYWVTYGGTSSKAMTGVNSPSDPSPFAPSTVVGKVFREDERVNVQNSGRQWLGQSFNPNDAVTYIFPLPGYDPAQRIAYRFALGARNTPTREWPAPGPSRFDITEHGVLLLSVAIGRTGGGYFDPFVVMTYPTISPPSNTFTEPQSQLRFSFPLLPGVTGTGYVDWIELLYSRQLVADRDVFNFHSHDTTAITSYSIGGFTQGDSLWVFDVSRLDSVVRIINPIIAGGQCTFQMQLTQGSVREMYVITDNTFRIAPSPQPFANQNLHGDTTSVDLVIIYHRDFLAAAQQLKAYRERAGLDRLTVRRIDIEQVYNEFSGGMLSPVGIRNYLRYLYYTSSNPPKYILLFGDGDFDYKRISTTGPNWIPPWETFESFVAAPLSSYATEDSLAIVTGSGRVIAGLGRLPVRSAQQANDVVNKIIEYETKVATDPWKLRVTIVGDDGLTTEGNEGTLHTGQADGIAELVPPLFEKQKIYLAEYPTVVTSGGRRKPTVNQSIIDKINEGTLVLNYTGHGNPRLWAHEFVFVRETDFPLLANKEKYCLITAATCNYSQFDNPFDQSGGEQIILMPDAGAIATVAASRLVFSGSNDALIREFYRNLFQPDTLGRVARPRLGDVFFQTKQRFTGGLYDNDKKFVLMGDPSVRFAIPARFAAVDSLNGLPASSLAQFRALDTASIVAGVRDTFSNQLTNFTGTALLTVYDSDRIVTISIPAPESFFFTYTAPGGIIFRGQSGIENGRLTSSFIVPRDISYSNNQGRISLFFGSNAEDGAGVTRNLRVGGTNPNAAADSRGPRISLYLENRNFRPGDLVGENPRLIADLSDEHGINVSNTGIGHGLEAWIDDRSESIDLSNYYQGKINSFQEGTIEYILGGLAPGSHRIRLRAWDTYNNSDTAKTNFDVAVSVGLKISNLFNYPNPFSSLTTFTFQHNQLVAVDAEVKIYTVAGRLVESLSQTGVPDQFVRIPWDGRDRDGDEIANGVYLYKIIVRTQDGRFTSESIGKLSKLR